MCLGFSLSVLVLSLVTLVHHANAIDDRRGGSSGHTRNSKLAFPSAFESSAQDGGFHGSSRSSHSAGGQVVGYSPEGSVSSYGSSSLNVRKPTQSTQPSRRTNADAEGVIQTKAGMWDLVSPKNVKRIESQQPGYQPKPQQPRYQPKRQHHGYQSTSVYQPKQPKPQQPRYQPKRQQHVYQTKQPKPQQPRYQPKRQQYGYQSPSVYQPQQLGYQPKPQQYGYQPKPQQPKLQQPGYPSLSGYQPKPQRKIPKPKQNSQPSGQTNADAEGVIQTKAGMWDLVSPKNVHIIESQQAGYKPKPQQPGYQHKPQLPGSQPKPQQHGYQSPSVYQPQQPSVPSLSIYQPKPQWHIPKPTQNSQQSGQTSADAEGVIQTKAGMWDLVSPKNVKRIESQQPGYQPKPQQYGQQPKLQQPGYPSLSGYQPKPQRQIPKPKQNSQPSGQTNAYAEGVIQTKAGMWDLVSPKNVKRIESQQAGYKPKPQLPGSQSPSVYKPKQTKPQQPQQAGYQPKPQRQIPKPTQNSQPSGQTNPDAEGVMWDSVSPKNGTRLASVISLSRGIAFEADPNTPSESQPSVYQPKPHQVEIQMNAILEFLSPSGGVSGRNILPNLNVQMAAPPRTRGIRSQYSPRWQWSLVPV